LREAFRPSTGAVPEYQEQYRSLPWTDNSNSELSEHNVVSAGRMQKLERNPMAGEIREPIMFNNATFSCITRLSQAHVAD
jgi:hypothetical protein